MRDNAPLLEDQIIGLSLVRPQFFEKVIKEGIRAGDFLLEENRKIFKALQELFTEGTEWNDITIVELLKTQGIDEALLLPRIAFAPITADEKTLLKAFKKQAIRNRLKREFEKALEEIDKEDPEKVYKKVLQTLTTDIRLNDERSKTYKVSDLIPEIHQLILARKETDRAIVGIPTGFSGLDRLTGGFQPDQLILIGGRPGMGKTSFALSMAREMLREGYKVGFISLEMSRDQLMFRLLAFESEIPLYRISSGRISDEELREIENALIRIGRWELHINDDPSMDIVSLRLALKEMVEVRGIDIAFIDYLQLLRSPKRYASRQEEVADISRTLKLLSKELRIPIVALVQLSREAEKSKDKVPTLAHLRESGALEQDADIVIFIHRPAYYKKVQGKPTTPEEEKEAQIIVAKQRQGATGSISVEFDPKLSLFRDPAPTEGDIEDFEGEIPETLENLQSLSDEELEDDLGIDF